VDDVLPEPLRRLLHAAAGSVAEEEVLIESTSRSRWIAVRMTSVSFSLKAPANGYLLMILQDVSAQKSLEQEREQARNSMALAEMSSVLAHEIRNPLGAMELFLTLLREQAMLGEDALGWVGHLTTGVRSLSATVENVLRFYSTGALARMPIDLAQVIAESAQFLAPMAASENLQLRCACDEALSVRGDAQALRQVLLNLCGNGLRHSRAAGMVEIAARRYGATVRVEVKDNGTGIAPEHLPHIFEAGFSANRRTSGLGLAVSKRIVVAHGGTLSVSSTGDDGTVMLLELPSL
jgi:two-component system sensor histidine kinase FlrB